MILVANCTPTAHFAFSIVCKVKNTTTLTAKTCEIVGNYSLGWISIIQSCV